MLINPFSIMLRPRAKWQEVSELPQEDFDMAAMYPVLFAMIPAAAWYYGTTQVGWTVGDSTDIVKLTEASAFRIICAFYGAMVISILAIGYSIHWMSGTYGVKASFSEGIAISGITATPLFLAGLLGFYPVMWVDLILGTVAACWSVYLLYIGVPVVLKIPEEKGFLYSSAIMAVCLVLLIVILVATAILWDMGFMPVFTDA
jgi:hypothetical protein